MTIPFVRPCIVSIVIAAVLKPVAYSALELSPMVAESVVNNIREHIFLDRRYVSPRSAPERCDSLSGPECGKNPLANTGVIPEALSGSLHIDFDVFHRTLPMDLWEFNYTSVITENYALPAPTNSLILRDLPDGNRITSHYSMTLPSGTGLAKLEGRWLLQDSVSMETFLPAYIKFSRPVLVKSLWAELTYPIDEFAPSGNSHPNLPVVILAFRLGKETVWTTEAIIEPGFTLDVTTRGSDGHGPLRACDQIVIFSTMKGLKIVSIDFEELAQQVLVPTLLLVPTREAGKPVVLKQEKVDVSALISKQIISLREVVENDYEMRLPPGGRSLYTNSTRHIAELVAKDIGAITPIGEIYQAIKDGRVHVPKELRKNLLKHEKDVSKLIQSMAEKAVGGLFSTAPVPAVGHQNVPTRKTKEEDESIRILNDLIIAAMLHL